MPPGLNMIPNFSRNLTEYALLKAGVIKGNADALTKTKDILKSTLDSFDPLGGGPLALQVTPTALRPVVSLGMNQDVFERPISRADQPGRPVPGYLRSRDNSSWANKNLAKFINESTGGTQYQKGYLSPTADDLDYLAGQYLGGVSREVMKAGEAAKSLTTGEQQPLYRMPIVGKLVGDTESQQSIANRYYQNANKMQGYKAEYEGRSKNPGTGNPNDVFKENPEARLFRTADNVHNIIKRLDETKKMYQKTNNVEGIKKIEDQKTRVMKQFNDQVRKLE